MLAQRFSHALKPILTLTAVAITFSKLGVVFTCAGETRSPLEAVRQKNFGIAYLEQEQPEQAADAFRDVIRLMPDETLGYADLGLAYLRAGQLVKADYWLTRARQMDPRDHRVLLLVAEVYQAQTELARAVTTASEAKRLAPQDLFIRYFIYQAARAQSDSPEARALADHELTQLYQLAPENLAVLVRYARMCASLQRAAELQTSLKTIRAQVRGEPAADQQLSQISLTEASIDWKRLEQQLAVLENVLRPTRVFRQAMLDLQFPLPGKPILEFSPAFYELLIPYLPRSIPVQFVQIDTKDWPQAEPSVHQFHVGSLDLADADKNGRPDILAACVGESESRVDLWLDNPTGWQRSSFSDLELNAANSVFVDTDDDGFFEVVGVGDHGSWILHRQDATGLLDHPQCTWLDRRAARSIGLIDMDNEGDLDLCAGLQSGLALWRQGVDNSWRETAGETGLPLAGPAIIQLATSDFDEDLDTDLVAVDAAGQMRLFDNCRHGHFAEMKRGLSSLPCETLVVRDFDNNGLEDIAFIAKNNSLWCQRNQRRSPTEVSFAIPLKISTHGVAADLVTAFDVDNDGWQDLVVAGQRQNVPAIQFLRNRGDGRWQPLQRILIPERCLAIDHFDMDADGDLDLICLGCDGVIRGWRNEGGNANHWLDVRLRGLQIAGGKNNLHGIGCRIEIKAGLDYQLQTVRQPVTHFGLGKHKQADLMRVMWSNGVPQNKLRPATNQTVLEPQILKGSCPNLYCWNGEKFVFVTDILAGAPLGLQLAEGIIAPDNPRELMTIPRHHIGIHDSEFVFQCTSELWETVYLDQLLLWVVDHPRRIEVFTDQRFMPPPYETPLPQLTTQRHYPQQAMNSSGHDVTDRLLASDYRYPEELVATRHQGVVKPHRLTLDFGSVPQLKHPLLIMRCWVFWTDTSINVARSQTDTATPSHTLVQTWHSSHGWQTWDHPFGMPNGKDKWVVLDLSDSLDTRAARVQLTSESAIYWDEAFLVEMTAESPHTVTRVQPHAADLHRGGFHRIYRPAPHGPHLYDYQSPIEIPLWMNMRGMATRYGDVTSLVAERDDRLVVFSAGDELTIRFDAATLPPLPRGWERDFLFYSDGWEKDADRNTVTGETVEPLPFHAMAQYPYETTERYPDDARLRRYQKEYNTRRIGPDAFRRFVREYQGSEPPPLPWESEPATRGDHSH
jgi:Flp pilus assembly protein TadD